MQPLRILQALAPARVGGLESVVIQLAGGLCARGHDLHVATVIEPGREQSHPFVEALRHHGVPVHVLVLGSRDYLGERRAVRDLVRRLNVDVLHTHGYRADAVLGDIARQEGRANMMTLHGFVGGSNRGRLYEWLQIQASRFASGVVAVSTPIVERLRRYGITRNVHLLRNAVIPAVDVLPHSDARRALGLPQDVPMVGWVGRLSPEKGPDIFVQALALTHPFVHGVMVGEGPELDATKRLADRLGLNNRLHFTGMIAGASRYLAALDGLVLTSRTEGTPMILLEAMWAGVPIIATAVGGVPDLLSMQEAVLCETQDIVALSKAMAELSSLPGPAAERARRANERVARESSADAWLEQHERLYRLITT